MQLTVGVEQPHDAGWPTIYIGKGDGGGSDAIRLSPLEVIDLWAALGRIVEAVAPTE